MAQETPKKIQVKNIPQIVGSVISSSGVPFHHHRECSLGPNSTSWERKLGKIIRQGMTKF